jgi:hypothetical protein
VLRLRYEHLRMNGWKPFKTFTMRDMLPTVAVFAPLCSAYAGLFTSSSQHGGAPDCTNGGRR